MKKIIKYFIIIICLFILFIVIDLLCIKINHKPLFGRKLDNLCDCEDKVYKGLIYDTYVCDNEVYIKSKNIFFTCHNYINDGYVYGKIIDIKDNYIVIIGNKDSTFLSENGESNIILSNNTKVWGSNNLIIGQSIKAKVIEVKELYPSEITVSEIIIE